MYRSGSSTRVSDEFLSPNHTTSSSTSTSTPADSEDQLLPTHNLINKKEKLIRVRSAEAALHIIPLLLILCATILWFCSTPVDLASKGDPIAVRVRI